MKKIFFLLLILASCQPLHIVLEDQTVQQGSRAVGWQTQRAKVDFQDSTQFTKAPEFEGGVKIGDYVSGSGVVELDSVTTDGTNIYFYTGSTILTATPGTGSAAWGAITGTLTNQVDLTNALGLKANLASPTFTGTVAGITAAMTGSMSTSHAANAITGTNISNWNTAYGWGDPTGLYAALVHSHVQTSITGLADSLLARYTKTQTNTLLSAKANTSALAGYVPTTTTVNGHYLSSNVSVTASDVSLGNLTNKAQVELEDSVNYANGYMSRYDGVTGLALKVNISDTAAMLTNYPLTSEVSSTYLPIANPTATGTATFPILRVGNSASNTITPLDSISHVTGATDISFYDGADTLNPYIPFAGRIDLYDAMDTTLVIATKTNLATLYNDTAGIFNVLDYGALGNGSNDDTGEIQACIDAAEGTVNSVVYFPIGTYLISDTLVVNQSEMTLKGAGFNSIIHTHTANIPLLKLQDNVNVTVRDLTFNGNGGALGVGATNDDGIYLDHARYCIFDKVNVQYNGRHGIYGVNGTWGNVFTDCYIVNNLEDGINSITITSQENTGQNGNAMSVTNSTISANGQDGIRWAANGLNVNGSTFESNEGAGIEIGARLSDQSAVSANIIGNYFEDNDSSQIKLRSKQTGSVSVVGVVIEGNYIRSTQEDGDDALITHDVVGTLSWSLADSKIGKNYYAESATAITLFVKLEAPRYDVIVDQSTGWQTNSRISMGTGYGGGTRIYSGQPMTYIRNIDDLGVTGFTAAYLFPIVTFNVGSAIDITTDPQIVDGFNGQKITIIGTSNTNTLTLDDGAGLALSSTNIILGVGDAITLVYSQILDLWVELSRSDDPTGMETEIRKFDSDTIPLFVFGAGAGLAADTALFNNDVLIGSFYNSGSDTLHITELRGILKAGTGTETIGVGIKWHATLLDGSAGHLNNTDLTVTSMSTGTVDTSFDHNDIPPGVWVWGILSGASKDNKPTFLSLTMTGYKRNRKY